MKLTRIVSVVSFATAMCCGVSFCQAIGQPPMSAAAAANDARTISKPVRLPLNFEQNLGQAPAGVQYLAHSGHGMIAFYADRVELPCGDSAAELRIEGTQEGELRGEDPGPGVANYYSGRDRARWIEGVPLDEKLRYAGVARGVDLLFHGNAGQLEYDLEVAPGADATAVKFAAGADERVALNGDGSATVTAKSGGCAKDGVRMKAPMAYQTVSGQRVAVTAKFKQQQDGALGFEVGAYHHRLPLVIDPVVAYTNVIPANSGASVSAAALDSAGNLLLTGLNGPVYLMKLDPTGTQILFSSYLSSSGFSKSNGIAVDNQDNIYVTGTVGGPDFPTTSSNLGTCAQIGCFTGFVAKFSDNGTLVYSTLLGSGQQVPKSITVDGQGSAYVGGIANDNLFPAVNSFMTPTSAQCPSVCAGPFFAKLNPAGTGYVFSSYFGDQNGAGPINSIALDPQGNIYFAGDQITTGVPLYNALEANIGSGSFVAEFAPDGKTLLFSTQVGDGEGMTNIAAMKVGTDGTIYLAGTADTSFPYTANALELPTMTAGGTFAAAINPLHTALTYSTYLSYSGSVTATSLDAAGDFYIAGSFGPGVLPLKNAMEVDLASGGFVLELDPSGLLLNSTQFGGVGQIEIPNGLAIDGAGDIYLAGALGFDSFPVQGDNFFLDPINVGTGTSYTSQLSIDSGAMFVAKIAPTNQAQISMSYFDPVLSLRNAGSVDLHISQISSTTPMTHLYNNCGSTLPAGTACYVTPTDQFGGEAEFPFTITSDAQPASQTYFPFCYPPYCGRPVAPLIISDPAFLNFPPLMNGVVSAPLSFKEWNVGASSATLGVTATGLFKATNDCTSVAPGAFCTVNLVEAPTAANNSSNSSFWIYVVGGNSGYVNPSISPLNPQPQYPLMLSADAFGFGDVLVGQSSLPRLLNVTNTSNVPVTLGTPVFTQVQTSVLEFGVSGGTCTGATLGPQQNCTLMLAFQPTFAGTAGATMVFPNSASTPPFGMNGAGIIPVALSITPNQFDFGPVILGTSTSQIFTLKNTGTSTIVVTNAVASLLDLTASSEYAEQDTCVNPRGLASQSTCTVTIIFTPQTQGPRPAVLTILLNNGESSQAIPLNGSGIPTFTATPMTLDFGSTTPLGTQSTAQQVLLTNQTSTSQAFTAMIGGPFVLTNGGTCTNSLAANSSCTLQIAFAPTGISAQMNALNVTPANGGTPLTVALTGTGSGAIATLSPASISFGSQTEGVPSSAQTVTLMNTGNATLSSIAFSFTGGYVEDFLQRSNCEGSLAPMASCSISVSFTPSSLTLEQGILTVLSSALASPQVVTLSGTGVAPDFSLGATAASQTVTPGGNATYALSFPSTLTGTATLSCSGLPQYASCSFAPQSVTLSTTTAAGSTLTVSTEQTVTSETRPITTPVRGAESGAGVLALAGCLMAGVYRRRRWVAMLVALLALTLGGMAGCSGGSGGGVGGGGSTTTTHMTPAGTYTITVTATMGTDVHTLPVTLTVN